MTGTPRAELTAYLRPLIPRRWQLVDSERAVDQHGTLLRLQLRTIRRHPQAGTGVHLLDFDATVTVDGQDLEAAEDRLDDELTALVQVLDDAGILWSEWTKKFYDGALGYQGTVSISASRALPEPEPDPVPVPDPDSEEA